MQSARCPSNVIPCRVAHLAYLSSCMREDEMAQFLAVTGAKEFSADHAAHRFIDTASRSHGFAFTVLRADNTPAVAGGYELVAPGVWQSWMVGCDEGWSEQWRSITKVTLWLMERMFEHGARRLQTNAMTSRVRTIEWFERSLGLQREGVFRQFGARGEDFAMFARVREE